MIVFTYKLSFVLITTSMCEFEQVKVNFNYPSLYRMSVKAKRWEGREAAVRQAKCCLSPPVFFYFSERSDFNRIVGRGNRIRVTIISALEGGKSRFPQ